MSAGLNVWSGRALQEGFADLAGVGLASNVSGLTLERVMLRAIMDISARAISLAARPRLGYSGHQYSHAPGRPILHFVSSSRRPRRVMGIALTPSIASHLVQFRCSCPGAARPCFDGLEHCAILTPVGEGHRNFSISLHSMPTQCRARPLSRHRRPCRTIAALHSENAAGIRVHGSVRRASSIANRCLLKYTLIAGGGPSRSPLHSG